MKKYVLIFVLSLFSLKSYAYLDPGTGSILIQGLIAGIAAVLIFFKNIWKRIKSFFKKIKKT